MPNTKMISEPKFTKGEKCIFLHLVVTFITIIILFIIYVIHICTVKHTQYGVFKTFQNIPDLSDAKHSRPSENLLVGYLYLNMTIIKFVCNTLLVKPRWSLCTANCVALRTDPDMAHLLFDWGIKYYADVTGAEFRTRVRRSIAHPLFNTDTFANNVGLLEHTISHPLVVPNSLTSKSDDRYYGFILGWNYSDTEFTGITDDHNFELVSYDVNDMNAAKCSEAVSPVMVVRTYELCVTLQEKRQMFLDYGAVVFANSKVIGIFSWGERSQKELPMVIINITSFQDWVQTIVIA